MATKNDSTELTTTERSDEELALMGVAKDEIDSDDLIVPILKLVQGTTKGVPEGTPLGHFLNALTMETYAPPIEFTIAAFKKGRFGTDEDDNIIASGFGKTAEDGTLWQDHPLAEEQWKAAVNRGEKEWGSGPPISTTYNFFGLIAGSDVPVRFSMMRTAAPAAKKLLTMVQFLPALWDVQFNIGTKLVEGGRNKYYVPVIEQGAKSTPEQRQAAVKLAQAVSSDRVRSDDDPDAPPTGGKRPTEGSSGLGV